MSRVIGAVATNNMREHVSYLRRPRSLLLLHDEVGQLGERVDTQFFHNVAAMQLHRSVADVEHPGDLLAGQSLDDFIQHAALTFRQRRKTLGKSLAAAGGSPIVCVAPQRVVDTVEQLLLAIRFLHEVDRTGLDRLDGDRDVGRNR